jgi:cytochrome c-type biogenesis protein CcmH
MIPFYIAATVFTILVLLWLFHPYFGKASSLRATRQQLNAAIYREDLAKLEVDRKEGVIDQDAYGLALAELRQRLHQDTADGEQLAVLRSPKKTIVAIGIFIPLLAVLMYWWLGSAQQLSEVANRPQMTRQDVEKMVSALSIKMEQNPGDLKGWVILARSYKALGRTQEAEKAYDRAGSFIENDPQLLADYADVAANNANGNFVGKPQALINRALKLDPNNMMALWLAGAAAYSKGDYRGAVQFWQHLAQMLPPNSEDAKVIEGSIMEARTKGHLPATAKQTSLSGQSVSGVVELKADLKAKIKPDDVVMVIAKAPGVRMPVAIMQAHASELPLQFSLNDSMAMTPTAVISNLQEVTLEVRISKSGQATPEPGDLYSSTQTVKVGAKNLKVLVDQVRP